MTKYKREEKQYKVMQHILTWSLAAHLPQGQGICSMGRELASMLHFKQTTSDAPTGTRSDELYTYQAVIDFNVFFSWPQLLI